MPPRVVALVAALTLAASLVAAAASAAPAPAETTLVFLPSLLGHPAAESPATTPGPSETATAETPTATAETPTATAETPTATAETPTATAETPTATAVTATPVPGGFADQVVDLVNAERAKLAGCPALAVSDSLTAAAERHNGDMAANDIFDHVGSDGSTPGDRAAQAGYTGNRVGENIAVGYPTPAEVVLGWMESADHRANILNCAYRDIGVAHLKQPDSEWVHYWTQVFGGP